jgi:hypothetical protein
LPEHIFHSFAHATQSVAASGVLGVIAVFKEDGAHIKYTDAALQLTFEIKILCLGIATVGTWGAVLHEKHTRIV